MAAATTKPEPVTVDPGWIRQQLTDLSSLLNGSAERTRPIFKKLNLNVRLVPVDHEGDRPYLRAVATANLDALTGEIPLLRRSLEEAAEKWKLTFALPPNAKTGRWRERGRRRV